MSGEPDTLYDRIGGAPAVSEMVDQFYALVFADEQLRPFFENSSVDRLKSMQNEFFAAAMDGPMMTSDVDLAAIHQGMGINRKLLTRFVNHLITVLDERSGINRRDAMSILASIATYSDLIIGDSGGADG